MITTNLDEVIKELNKFISQKEKQLEKVADLTPRELGRLIKNEVVESIRREGLVASGDLLKSVSVTGVRASTQMREATVGSSSPYAQSVEEGTKPRSRTPRVSEIYNWMIDKGMQPSEMGAFLIARKIHEKGIPARKPFEKGVQAAEGKIDHEMTIILNKTVTDK